MTVLVVEDDPLVASTTVAMLEELGHRALMAETADLALSIIESGSGGITHVLADVNMDGALNGLTLARLLSTLYPDVAVVVTSGDPTVRDPAAQHELRFMPKPWTLSDLQRVLPDPPARP